ncbi:hypothetical protein HHI36_006404 [Cryptolaemus montrouzieri]|uniref:Methyltransferase type 11 domain-containing protein n=1 Tax=Cryptolaemus montrouzieri TaxID=559131 RepID=A0ABD2NY25_9CUCU
MSLLLPKSKEEFSKGDYWNSFFQTRGSKAFEWYGEYDELSNYFHKYIKEKDQILITGCGNSSIGENLYDVGYRDIINIDISQIVIRQMNQKVNNREGLKYLHMDALKTTFADQHFNVVLDKGTLDALMPDDKEETVKRITKYFDEIQRITRFGSRYICITLLQEHILTILLDYFPKNNWMFRVVRCFEAEEAAVKNGERLIPVFIVICTKFNVLPKQILEANLSSTDKLQRFENTSQIKSTIMSSQQAAFVCASLQQNSISSDVEISLDLFEPEGVNPKYTVYVVDSEPKKKNPPYAVFIVPQGRESEWLFSTKAGRRKLASMSNHNRLLIITMHRNQNYNCLEHVQNELADIIRDLTRQIRINRRKYLSEAKLKPFKNRKGIIKDVVDITFLTCKHHLHMILGSYVGCREKKDSTIAVLGLGGGGLCSFMNKFIPNAIITGVEIDPEMVKIAFDWFGLQKNEKLKIEVNDGLKYLEELTQNGKTLNALLFDVDSKDSTIGMSCPPKEFLEDAVLDNVTKIIDEKGLFILNVVIRDESLRPPIVTKLVKRFEGIVAFKIEEELNEIFICSHQNKLILKEELKNSIPYLTKFLEKYNNLECIDFLISQIV